MKTNILIKFLKLLDVEIIKIRERTLLIKGKKELKKENPADEEAAKFSSDAYPDFELADKENRVKDESKKYSLIDSKGKKLAENQSEKPFSLVVLDSFVTPKEKADFASKLGKVLSLDDGQENPEILGKINYLLDIIPSSKLKRSPNWKNTDFIPKPKNKKTEKKNTNKKKTLNTICIVFPFFLILPSYFLVSPKILFTRVVFPLPLSPTIPRICPFSNCNETS